MIKEKVHDWLMTTISFGWVLQADSYPLLQDTTERPWTGLVNLTTYNNLNIMTRNVLITTHPTNFSQRQYPSKDTCNSRRIKSGIKSRLGD